jgi:putative DNA methylase
MHKWFARRASSAFRALLVAAATDGDDDFWDNYYCASLEGLTVLDPFVGGGTSVVEANRLGAQTIGVDIDSVACAVTSLELRAAEIPDLMPALNRLNESVGRRLREYYMTVGPNGDERTVVHFFWVQEVDCGECGMTFEAHPQYRLAYEAEGRNQWAFCPGCKTIEIVDRRRKVLNCKTCGLSSRIDDGTVDRGNATCPSCSHGESLIEYARRTRQAPRWRLFALESIVSKSAGRSVPMAERLFHMATDLDRARYERARSALVTHLDSVETTFIPEDLVPVDVADTRLRAYGYRRYRELFNDRQLLHLSLLAKAIGEERGLVHRALAIAFSDHLATNCMLTCYASGWRRLVPLFAIRGFRHIPRPVEINPWLNGTGRGTFPNALRQVMRAKDFALAPTDPLVDGGFVTVSPKQAPAGRIINGDARSLTAIEDASIDIVLTDPPYLDNIAYSELSDFFRPWLQQFGLVKSRAGKRALSASLAASGRQSTPVSEFADGLGEAFTEIARVLKDDGVAALTYRHHSAQAWLAFGEAATGSGLRCVQLFPLLAEGPSNLHTHEGSTIWDVVFVLKRTEGPHNGLTERQVEHAKAHTLLWKSQLESSVQPFRAADELNFIRAAIVGASLGLFPGRGPQIALQDAFDQITPKASVA